ncbi:MAG: AAA family ATPase [Campylobacterota bacterium]|nr:AAA family ATPase [Campylobacterota bacterium]
MVLQKLPIGIQTFEKIRKEDYLYIDKTDIAYDIINNYSYVFLSRPRRFGKSLFMDTIHNIYEGNKEYFSGLAIEDKWDWDTKYPVIKIAFGKVRTPEQLKESIFDHLEKNEKRLGLKCKNLRDYAVCFSDLIQTASEKYNQKVVILIDEYDKPILDNVDNLEVAIENREILSRFYTEIKNADAFIKFAMLTGVSKFSKASIFSGLNMITDLSLSKRYADVCGYTQHDVETSFKPYLEDVDMDKFKCWYNGYNFLKSDMYNPFDVLQFIANGYEYKNYWFETGTPTFLIKLIEKNNYFLPNLLNLVLDEKLISSFDIENLDLEVILYQSGYLTIKSTSTNIFEDIEYKLQIPNKEVKQSLNNYIIKYLIKDDKSLQTKTNIYKSLLDKNLEDFKSSLEYLFASIPYNNYTNNKIDEYEGFYASVVYVYLQSLGLDIIGEDVTNKGRIDLTIKLNDVIFILEFKVDGQKGEALNQIKEKNYFQKYHRYTLSPTNYQLFLIGVEFSTSAKNISNFEWEIVKEV